MRGKFRLFFPCYVAFFVNGAMVLLVGSILPYIIEEKGISYGVAGGLLSSFALGNLAASFINPVLAAKVGRKRATVLAASFIPLAFIILSTLPPVPVMYAALFFNGIGRGSCSIINNAVVHDNSDGKPEALNFLHMTFAAGAFTAPFLTNLYVKAGFGWRGIVYTIIVASILSVIGYGWMELEEKKEKISNQGQKKEKAFLKSADFYVFGFILFFYLGVENCVNGWFVTYFKSSGIMSDTYAANLVSITWVMVMLGRLVTAYRSKRTDKSMLILQNCAATAIFFLVLIMTENLGVITFAIAGLGFFFAGIYPTCISGVGDILKGSTKGMAYLLALAALGGIVTPQIVGMVADRAGMSGGILVLIVNVIVMVILAILNRVRKSRYGRA